MSKRFYYDCPIKALWMMKEFGVEIVGWDHSRYSPYAITFDDMIINYHENIDKKLYIFKESESIFNPLDRVDPISKTAFKDNKVLFLPEVEGV